MSSFRVIRHKKKYYVQKKIGIIFKKWEYLHPDGEVIDYDHELGDDTPWSSTSKNAAVDFMERAAYPNMYKEVETETVAWLDK